MTLFREVTWLLRTKFDSPEVHIGTLVWEVKLFRIRTQHTRVGSQSGSERCVPAIGVQKGGAALFP
jgi:hypothetical protein